jgi:hypothetical protein
MVQNIGSMPFSRPLPDLRHQLAEQVAVQAAAEAAIGGHDDVADPLHLALLARKLWPILRRCLGQVPNDLEHLLGVGPDACIRSCALRILEVATISMALVIFCVLLMLAILVRISLAPAISAPNRVLSAVSECKISTSRVAGWTGPRAAGGAPRARHDLRRNGDRRYRAEQGSARLHPRGRPTEPYQVLLALKSFSAACSDCLISSL